MFTKRMFVALVAAFTICVTMAPLGYSKGSSKIGYVDLRRAFYEYNKAKKMEEELNGLAEQRSKERTEKVDSITKMRDEAELLSDEAKSKKQAEVDSSLANLQTFDRETREEILAKRNDMFREVIDDIQKVVEEIGKKDAYMYILDARNIMYAEKEYDLTEEVLNELNK